MSGLEFRTFDRFFVLNFSVLRGEGEYTRVYKIRNYLIMILSSHIKVGRYASTYIHVSCVCVYVYVLMCMLNISSTYLMKLN